MVKRSVKHKKATSSKPSSYDSMMGSPMEANKHPVSNIPDPTGGAFQGMGLPMMGNPDPSAYGV